MPQRLNVLLIDNDADDIEVIRQTLAIADPDHRLTIATDGEAALDIVRSQVIQYPYLVLLDLYMSRLDGFAFLKELRDDPLRLTNPVFVITTADVAEHKSLLYKRGISGYLLKQKLGQEFEELVGFLIAYNKIVEYPERAAI